VRANLNKSKEQYLTYKEYIARSIGKKGGLHGSDGKDPTFIAGEPEDIDVLSGVHDDFVIVEGNDEYAIPLPILMVTVYDSKSPVGHPDLF
jgi:hypothetical protein